jgi:hypothetical protein
MSERQERELISWGLRLVTKYEATACFSQVTIRKEPSLLLISLAKKNTAISTDDDPKSFPPPLSCRRISIEYPNARYIKNPVETVNYQSLMDRLMS